MLREFVRRLKIGKAILAINELKTLTLRGAIEVNRARRKHLKRILKAKPILTPGKGALEVHMLLNHGRIYEGIWSLYSFLYFSGKPCRIVIHDDGTLTNGDLTKLNETFPKSRVIDRRTSDRAVLNYFRKKNLKNCERLRQTLAYGLKLFDNFFFMEEDSFILLDSDVLFFDFPRELITELEAKSGSNDFPNLFFPDNNYQYCLAPAELKNLLGRDCIERVNPGILRVKRGMLDFRRIEGYLRHPHFWNQGQTGHRAAELTIWAMELTRAGARSLPGTYRICPSTDEPGLIGGHYCGSIYWKRLFYTRGLARLAPVFSG